MKSRPYQDEARAAVREAWATREQADPHPLLVMATGTGKTETALGLVVDALHAGERVVWLAHREELVRQPAERLARYRPDLARLIGVEQAADCAASSSRFVCASIPTLAASPSRASRFGDAALLVVDEAHHSTSTTWRQVMGLFPTARRVGLTATPERADRADLSALWAIVYAYGIADAIEAGYLVPPYAAVDQLPGLDLGAIGGRHDYDDAALGAALMAAHVVDHTVAAMGRPHIAARLPDRDDTRELGADGRHTIVYTATVDQAEQTAAALRAAGWRARMLCGATPRDERAGILRAFEAREIDVITNPVVLTEGTDLPVASCLVLARPTRSWGLYVQMVGRGLRLDDGKAECLIVDIGGATSAHSLVAAPILVGSTECPKSRDGIHDFAPVHTGKGGACRACGRKVACLLGALGGGGGSHEWHVDRPTCRRCEAVQCEGAPSGWHDWIPTVKGDPPRIVHECGYCPATWTDQVSGLQAGARPYVREPVAPQRVAILDPVSQRDIPLTPEAWARSLGDLGLVVYIGDRVADRWTPWFLPGSGARRTRRTKLAAVPVSGLRARQILDDMGRRAQDTPELTRGELDALARRLVRDELTAPPPGAKIETPSTPRQLDVIRQELRRRGLPDDVTWGRAALGHVPLRQGDTPIIAWASTGPRAYVVMSWMGVSPRGEHV